MYLLSTARSTGDSSTRLITVPDLFVLSEFPKSSYSSSYSRLGRIEGAGVRGRGSGPSVFAKYVSQGRCGRRPAKLAFVSREEGTERKSLRCCPEGPPVVADRARG